MLSHHDFFDDLYLSYRQRIDIDEKYLVSVSLLCSKPLPEGKFLISSHFLKHLTLECVPNNHSQNSAIIECPNLISLTSKYIEQLFIHTPILENLEYTFARLNGEIRTKTSLHEICNFTMCSECDPLLKKDFSFFFNLLSNTKNSEFVSEKTGSSYNHRYQWDFAENKRLRKIQILDNSSLESLSLPILNVLEELRLQCPVLRTLNIEPCPVIKKLRLENFYFLDDAMLASILNNSRKSLEKLSAFDCSPFTNISLQAFPRLQKLSLSQCNKLKTVSISGSNALSKLKVFSCVELNAIDFGSSLNSIQELSILAWHLPFDFIETQVSKMTKLRYLCLENVNISQSLALSNENLRALKLSLGVFKLIPLDLPR